MRETETQKVLVIGLGEVGRALFDVLKENGHFDVYGLDLDKAKMRELSGSSVPSIDVMHVCIGCYCQAGFVNSVVAYAWRFRPNVVIINSTVPPGTTMMIDARCSCLVAHSPFRGVYVNPEHMKAELKKWTKYIGGANVEAGEAADKHFKALGLKTRVLNSCAETELAKLFETTSRACMITCFQEMHRISRYLTADFGQVVDFLADTHRIRYDRPVMFPGVIEGHCLIPNVQLLLQTYNSPLLRFVLESNEKRKQEIRDKEVEEDVEKVEKMAENLDFTMRGARSDYI